MNTNFKTKFNPSPHALILWAAAALVLLLFSTASLAQFWSNKTAELLPEDQAFSATAHVAADGRVKVNWSIADDYYMYRDQFSVEIANEGMTIGELTFPDGVVENDPEFGEVVVYFYNVELSGALSGTANQESVDLILKGQGCNKPVGICYPPLVRNLRVEIPAAAMLTIGAGASENQEIKPSTRVTDSGNDDATRDSDKSFHAYIVSAFLAGILLSFTPCVLPMIPILAGVIAGQRHPSKMRSGWLAICYVTGTVVTYVIAGAIAGATGAQLQAYFQNAWVIISISGLLVVLAASLFGWFKIQLPSAIQSRLSASQSNNKSVSVSSFVLGLISALVVGACVSPILILALGAAISKGDPVLGAAIMGSMAIGMGLLLVLFGFGAGWILPKAGAWMNQVQILFGMMVLGVAIYLLSALTFVPSLFLWSGLLLYAGFYCWQLASSVHSVWSNALIKSISAGLIIWGSMALVGGSQNGTDIVNPLSSIVTSQSPADQQDSRAKLGLQTVTTLAEAQQLLRAAKAQGQPVLIDFYADWCLDCKRMHRTTFNSAAVQSAMSGWRFIEIDVTNTSAESERVKRYFEVFGPPATLFFQSNGEELLNLRRYGYINEKDFLTMLARVK